MANVKKYVKDQSTVAVTAAGISQVLYTVEEDEETLLSMYIDVTVFLRDNDDAAARQCNTMITFNPEGTELTTANDVSNAYTAQQGYWLLWNAQQGHWPAADTTPYTFKGPIKVKRVMRKDDTITFQAEANVDDVYMLTYSVTLFVLVK